MVKTFNRKFLVKFNVSSRNVAALVFFFHLFIFLSCFPPLSDASSSFTLYYKGSFNPPFAHYQLEGGEWTTLPGRQMAPAGNGYFKLTIERGSAKSMQVAFNNGKDRWDSRNAKNYTIAFSGGAATYQEYGKITQGAPTGMKQSASSAAKSGTTKTITVYYLSPYRMPHIHYGVNGKWTTVPGIKMAKDTATGAFKSTIKASTAAKVEVVFNNGGTDWDNNSKTNYRVDPSAGVVTIGNGKVTRGKPAKGAQQALAANWASAGGPVALHLQGERSKANRFS